jgi:cytochrome c553
VAIDSAGHGLVLNENTRNLSIILFSTQLVVAVATAAAAAAPGAEADAEAGRRFFVTGLGRWSLNGQGWNSCEGCHPNGLTDNVSWFFASGPRQTVSLDGSFAPGTGAHRLFNWSAIFDENADFELNTRGVSGGVGALVHDTALANASRIIFDGSAPPAGTAVTTAPQNGLKGATGDLIAGGAGVPGTDSTGAAGTIVSVLGDWGKIDTYIRTIRAPLAPALDSADVDAGRALFTGAGGCVGCHGGAGWTISERFYTPSQAVNGATGLLATTSYDRGLLPIGLNPTADAGGGSAIIRPGTSIDCVLRAVGTFPIDPLTDPTGISAGVVVLELKEDMTTVALGANGFSPPSLIGVGAGAPYFHAGNARTLEEVFDPAFDDHTRALGTNFMPTPTEIRQLVAFLMSIDETTPALDPSLVGFDPIICPDSL